MHSASQVVGARNATLKANLHAKKNATSTAETKLYQCLRCSLNLLKSYLHHLPHSGANVYPESLKSATEKLEAVASLTEKLGFDPGEFSSDVVRLRLAAKKSSRKAVGSPSKKEKSGPALKKVSQSKPEKFSVGSKDKKVALNMINNLAREKFGPVPSASNPRQQRSPKKTNLKKEIQANGERKSNPLVSPSKKAVLGVKPLEHQQHEFVSGRRPPHQLDLADDELSHIVSGRDRLQRCRRRRQVDPSGVALAVGLSAEVVEQVVGAVCRELFPDDIVEQLLKFELME